MKPKLREIDHVVLRVADMERMVRFYADVLGAEFVAHRPEFKMTHLRAGGSMIDLVAGEAASGVNSDRNMDHFCLRVDPFDQDAIAAHLRSHGVPGGDVRTRAASAGTSVSFCPTAPA